VRSVNRQRSLLAHAAARAHAPHSATGACPLTAGPHYPLLSDSALQLQRFHCLLRLRWRRSRTRRTSLRSTALTCAHRSAVPCRAVYDARAYAPHCPTYSASGRPASGCMYPSIHPHSNCVVWAVRRRCRCSSRTSSRCRRPHPIPRARRHTHACTLARAHCRSHASAHEHSHTRATHTRTHALIHTHAPKHSHTPAHTSTRPNTHAPKHAREPTLARTHTCPHTHALARFG
jgi:hypothetical protein